MADRDEMPTYIAQCPKCGALVACSVADVNMPRSLREAIKHREEWERDGYRVSTVTVQTVRDWPTGTAFKHADGCIPHKRKRKTPKTADLFAQT